VAGIGLTYPWYGFISWLPMSHKCTNTLRLILVSANTNDAMFSATNHKILDTKLIDYLQFYVPLNNFSLGWQCTVTITKWRAAKFRPMLGAHGLRAGRDFYHATPSVTRDLGFSSLIQRTISFSCLLQYTRGCGWHLQSYSDLKILICSF
jgi:hypothetical protein